MNGPKKGAQTRGSRGRAPKRNTAQGRGGITRDTVSPAREKRPAPSGPSAERSGNAPSQGGKNPARSSGSAQSHRGTEGRRGSEGRSDVRGERGRGSAKPGAPRPAAPRLPRKKAMPDLKRVQLATPPPEATFKDRDGERLSFPDSALRRVAAQLLSDKRKAWRYRAFSFPLFTDRGTEQSFWFDFYVYDAEDSVIRLILVVPFESREVWDRVGRFKRQYPMYAYELWTPERLAQLQSPRGRLEF